jgi:dolichol-phosphate mannosyltransferase
VTAVIRILPGGRAEHAPPEVSVVVPAHDEARSLVLLAHRLRDVLERDGRTFEVVIVDDGSGDGSGRLLHQLHAEDARFRAVRLGRRQGKSAALRCGLEASCGSIVVMMDADLQDLPEELPRLLGVLGTGHFDVVQAWRSDRQDARGKIAASWAFNALCSAFSGVRLRDVNCGFKAMTREAASALDLRDDMHRFIPVMLHRRGFRVTEVAVRHARRPFGRSKYGPLRYFRGMGDLLTVALLERGTASRGAPEALDVVERIG